MTHDETRGARPADLLAAYEMGLLDEAERARFERAALEDPELLEELYEHAPAVRALREDPARYAAVLREARREGATPWLRRLGAWLHPRVLVPVALAAAAILLVVGLPGDDDLKRMAVLQPAPYARIEVRGADGGAEALFAEAMERYVAARYAEAAEGLDRALAAPDAEAWPGAEQARLYLGVSRLLAGEAETALAPLDRVAVSPQRALAERAHWYLAQAHLVLGDAPAARRDLVALRGSPVFGAEAAALLVRLDLLEAGD